MQNIYIILKQIANLIKLILINTNALEFITIILMNFRDIKHRSRNRSRNESLSILHAKYAKYFDWLHSFLPKIYHNHTISKHRLQIRTLNALLPQ